MVTLTSIVSHPYKPTTQAVPTCTETMSEYTILHHTNTTRDCHTVTWIECRPYLKSVTALQIELLRTPHLKVGPWSTCTVRTHTEIVTDRLLILSYDPLCGTVVNVRVLEENSLHVFRPWTVQGIKTARQQQSNKPQRQEWWCNLFSISDGAMNLFKICTVLFACVYVKKDSWDFAINFK